jgi:hypothetical protein
MWLAKKPTALSDPTLVPKLNSSSFSIKARAVYAQPRRGATVMLPRPALSGSQRAITSQSSSRRTLMPAVKSNRSKKKLKNRAKVKKHALKRRRVRARKAKGKY